MARLTATLRVPGVEGPVMVHALRGREAVSEAFRYEVDFSAPVVSVDEARGAVAALRLEDTDGNQRFFSGVVASLSVAARVHDMPRMRAVLAPLPSLIAHRHGYRIFQDAEVAEIVATVFKDAGLPNEAFRWELSRGYRKRSYCSRECKYLRSNGRWPRRSNVLEFHRRESSRTGRGQDARRPVFSNRQI